MAETIIRPIFPPERLTDGQVTLEPPTAADAEPHWRGEDDEMRRRFDWPLMRSPSLEHVQGAVARWIAARQAGGPMIVYALRDRAGALAGGCELRLLDERRANVSYWLYPAFRGRGYAARALHLLCEAAAAVPGLARLEAHIEPDNAPSRRLAERSGFTLVGQLPTEDAPGGAHLLYVLDLDQAGASAGARSS